MKELITQILNKQKDYSDVKRLLKRLNIELGKETMDFSLMQL